MSSSVPPAVLPGERLLRACAWCVALLAAFHLTGLRVDMNVIYPAASVESLMAHTSLTPYQYRILVPELIGALDDTGVLAFARLAPQEAAMLFEVLALLCAYGCLRLHLRELGASVPVRALAALALFFLLPFQYLLSRAAPFWYVWDAPAVMFFALGLWWLRRRRWVPYYACFALATVNKETAIFLTVVHALTGFGESSKRGLAGHVAVQLALWLAIKLALARAFESHLGMGMVPSVLERNLASLRTPSALLAVASSFGFTWIPVLLLRGWIEDRFTRRAVLVIPFFFAGALVSGELTELRIFGELAPLIVIALYALIARAARAAPAALGAS